MADPNDLKNSGNELIQLTLVAPNVYERITRQRRKKDFTPQVTGEELAEKRSQKDVNESWRETVDYIAADTLAPVAPPDKLEKNQDERTGVTYWTLRKVVNVGATLPALNSAMAGYAGHIVVHPTREEHIEGSP